MPLYFVRHLVEIIKINTTCTLCYSNLQSYVYLFKIWPNSQYIYQIFAGDTDIAREKLQPETVQPILSGEKPCMHVCLRK